LRLCRALRLVSADLIRLVSADLIAESLRRCDDPSGDPRDNVQLVGSGSSSKSNASQGGTTQQEKAAGRKGGKAAAGKS
jgi:hypothetical protein